MPPLFSVIIPAYNEEKYIGATLDSLQRQTLRDFEVIIVGNGCTDNTETVVKTMAKGENFRYLSLVKPNVSVARNAGALNAQGKTLIFLDADTRLAEDGLQVISEQFMDSIVVATTKTVPDERRWKYLLVMAGKNFLLATKTFKGFSGVLICRKEDFQAVKGYDPQVTIKEQHSLRRKLETKGEYRCINTPVITSMRRFRKWSLAKTSLFWLKQWVRHYQGKDCDGSSYEMIR